MAVALTLFENRLLLDHELLLYLKELFLIIYDLNLKVGWVLLEINT